jgi:hypothetical protein
MNNSRRAAILRLGAAAYEMNLGVLRGALHRDDRGRWFLGKESLDSWLVAHENEELVLVLGSLADETRLETRTCYTCGRDYTDLECPYCRASRVRLRGEA